jgi:hypothetical protein
MRRSFCLFPLSLFLYLLLSVPAAAQDSVLQFVFTSDVHYGITRAHFRGADKVSAVTVNRAMIAAINRLPARMLPQDGGVSSGKTIGHIDGILITGDIANRQETGIQPAAASWQQFEADYDHRVITTDRFHQPTPLLLTPGNHDAADAIGSWRPFQPSTDASSMAGIYNRMMLPAHPLSAKTYDYARNRIHYIRDIGGIRLLFVNCWPDSTEQMWIEEQLALLPKSTPVLLFTHANPDLEARFFANPNGNHGIDSTSKFENLLPEMLQDGQSVKDSTLIEQRQLAEFLKRHPQIKAYFHGHNNWTQFYQWHGPDNNISLPCFRVDSPMKGKPSATDETLISFELITIDPGKKSMTVREYQWNPMPGDPSVTKWGQTMTIDLL